MGTTIEENGNLEAHGPKKQKTTLELHYTIQAEPNKLASIVMMPPNHHGLCSIPSPTPLFSTCPPPHVCPVPGAHGG